MCVFFMLLSTCDGKGKRPTNGVLGNYQILRSRHAQMDTHVIRHENADRDAACEYLQIRSHFAILWLKIIFKMQIIAQSASSLNTTWVKHDKELLSLALGTH